MRESLLKPNLDAGASATVSPVWEPRILAMVCKWCTYAGADLAGTSRLEYAPNVRLIRYPCTGRMNPLFMLKAFEQGADGVLVSGCHPGDCHYVHGNLVARRRFALFRSLLDFVGIEKNRLFFSWVSAAEGRKWAQVVDKVTESVRSMGPMNGHNLFGGSADKKPVQLPPVDRPAASAGSDPNVNLEKELVDCCQRLFKEDQISTLLGYKAGSRADQMVPAVFRSEAEATSLKWNSRCHTNLANYLIRYRNTPGRVGIVLKPCDVPSVVVLIQESQMPREKVHLIGVGCDGINLEDEVASKCLSCDRRLPAVCDETIGSPPDDRTGKTRDPRDIEIEFLESLSAAERWEFWRAQFDNCIRCYACRGVCPQCYCEGCITEKHRPQWVPTSIETPGNAIWNIIRAFHLSGRCTQCDECTRVCPAGIRLDLLNRKMAHEFAALFDYRPGEQFDSVPGLAQFKDEDTQEFIL